MKPWVKYTIVRLGVFLVALVVLVLLLPNPYLATLIAAVVAFCVSYLFFAPLRRQVALELAEPSGDWEPIGVVELGTALDDAAGDALRFDPANTGGGIRPVGVVQTVRRLAYRASQTARPTT